ncbi:hypothetical protein H4582DRAFT_1980218, partial [Lactarius indigo]
VREKVFLGLLLVLLDRSIKDGLEIRRRGSCRRCLRHGSSREKVSSGMILAEEIWHGGAGMVWQLTPAQPPSHLVPR